MLAVAPLYDSNVFLRELANLIPHVREFECACFAMGGFIFMRPCQWLVQEACEPPLYGVEFRVAPRHVFCTHILGPPKNH